MRSLLCYKFQCNSCNATYFSKTKRHFKVCVSNSSVKWGHLAYLEPNSINTIFLDQNPMGSSSPL